MDISKKKKRKKEIKKKHSCNCNAGNINEAPRGSTKSTSENKKIRWIRARARVRRRKYEFRWLKSCLRRPVRCPNWKIELRMNEMRCRTAQSSFFERLVADRLGRKSGLVIVLSPCTSYCVPDKWLSCCSLANQLQICPIPKQITL